MAAQAHCDTAQLFIPPRERGKCLGEPSRIPKGKSLGVQRAKVLTEQRVLTGVGGVFYHSASGGIAAQGYISVQGASVIYPAVGVDALGNATAVFTLVGPNFFPSAAYASIDLAGGAGDVHIAASGTAPEDGFTGYTAFGGSRIARWGDYSAAAVDELGNFWLATECIPNAPRTQLADWGSFSSTITP